MRSLFVMLLIVPASAFAQAWQPVVLHVTGNVPTHLDLSVADLASLPRLTLHVTDEKGVGADYAGVPVAAILEKAGAPLGKKLKGPNMAVGVLAGAPDGYHVLYALAEFDAAFTDRVIILADHRDGKPLDAHEGPLRIVVPGDRRGARWIRGVTTLEVTTVH